MKQAINNDILITGTVAFDEIETPKGSSGKIMVGRVLILHWLQASLVKI